jgi:thiol reductant ABC exporter CydD subunit
MGAVRAVDARLMRWGRPTRIYLATSVVVGAVKALLIVAQAWLLAFLIAGAFIEKKNLAELKVPMALLLGVVALRALTVWLAELSADRCSARVKSDLRSALVERVALLGPDGRIVRRSGDLATLAVRGIDALDGYFARYLPQLFLAVIVPLTVLVAVVGVDWVSAVIMAVTLPLIPVFMALIGMATRARSDRQLATLQVLSGHFLDVVSGLATLKIFGRSKAQVRSIDEVTDSYRRTTMATLRLTFLSSLVLELLGSVSVALVAVAIGLRLLAGHMDLRAALFVLVLAPEAYLPLRQVGADYHASSEGLSAAEQVFEVLETPLPRRGTSPLVPNPAYTGLVIDSLRVTYPGRDRPALDGVSLAVTPGEVLALVGDSGCGKSTLLHVVLGLVEADAGTVYAGDTDVATLDPDAWRAQIAWVPQRPHLFAASITDNIRLGRAGAGLAEVHRAVADAGLSELVARLPQGLDTRLGEGGTGLSAGERQRVALARAFLRDAPLLLLDEPTANLDGRTEAEILGAVRRLSRGRTVILVAHRPALLTVADRVIDLSRAGVPL